MEDLDLGATIRGFSPGQKLFGRYELVRLLGRGGMGVVWLARDQELSRETALKFLPELVAMDPNAIGDMKREVRRAMDLAHPHIVRIHDFVTDGRTAAVSMEYVDGQTLAALRQDRPGQVFTPAELLPWLKQLGGALDYAHTDARVVHRDLKAANLMIDTRGRLKVLDFGIAASIADSVSRVSNQGSSGTPVYMSPQQMMGEDPAVTDDVYSIGATVYELLTGKPPFHSGNIILQVQQKVPPRLNERLKVLGLAPVSVVWDETIAACLEKDAALRPRSTGEVVERLAGNVPAAAPVKIPAPEPTAVTGAAPVPAQPPAGSAAAATFLALVLAGCGLAPVWFLLDLRSYRLNLPEGLPASVQMLVIIGWMVAASVVGTRLASGRWHPGRAVGIAAVFACTQVLYTGFAHVGYYPQGALFSAEGAKEFFVILPAAVLGGAVALFGWGRAGGSGRMLIRGLGGMLAGALVSIGVLLLPKQIEGQPIVGWAPDLLLPLAGFGIVWWRQAVAADSRPVAPRSPWLHVAIGLLIAAAATGVLLVDWHRGYYYSAGVREAAAWRERIYFLLWCLSAFGLGALALAGTGRARLRWLLAAVATAVLGVLFRMLWRTWAADLGGEGSPAFDSNGVPSLNDPGLIPFFIAVVAGLLVVLVMRTKETTWQRLLAALAIAAAGGVAAWAAGWIPGGISVEAAESAATWYALQLIGLAAHGVALVMAFGRAREIP